MGNRVRISVLFLMSFIFNIGERFQLRAGRFHYTPSSTEGSYAEAEYITIISRRFFFSEPYLRMYDPTRIHILVTLSIFV